MTLTLGRTMFRSMWSRSTGWALVLLGLACMGCSSTGSRMLYLSHDVYFTLAEDSPEARAELVTACNELLPYLPGIIAFTVGERAEEFTRDVNDDEFHVALHLLFLDGESHDRYQTSRAHQELLARFAPRMEYIRVFDSWVFAR